MHTTKRLRSSTSVCTAITAGSVERRCVGLPRWRDQFHLVTLFCATFAHPPTAVYVCGLRFPRDTPRTSWTCIAFCNTVTFLCCKAGSIPFRAYFHPTCPLFLLPCWTACSTSVVDRSATQFYHWFCARLPPLFGSWALPSVPHPVRSRENRGYALYRTHYLTG